MSNIGQRVFVAGGNQLYMSLANEEYVRTLSIGANWTKLRLGLLAAITPNGVSNILASEWLFGLCSGTAAPVGAATTTNFIGQNFVANGLATGTFTYVANAGSPYYSGAASPNIFKKVGVTATSGGATQAPFVTTNTGSLQRRTPIYLDITKGSPSWTVQGWTWGSVNVALDWTFANFMEGLEVNTTPTIGGTAMSGGSSATVAFDEVAGAINTVDVLWSSASFPAEIYAIGVYRFT